MRWLALWGLLVAVCFGAVCVALYDNRRDAMMGARETTANLGLLAASSIARDVELFDRSLEVIASGSDAESISLGAMPPRYFSLFADAPSLRSVGLLRILDRNGMLVGDSTLPQLKDIDFSDRDYFRVHLGSKASGLFVSKPFRSQVTKLWTIALSRRITLPDGSFGGVALGLLRIEHIDDLFRQIDLGKQGTLALLRADGVVLARFPDGEGLLGHSFAQERLFRQYQSSGSGHFEAAGGMDGVARLYVFNRVAGLPLVMTVGMAKRQIYASWHGATVIIGFTMLASCIATIWLVWMLRYEFMRRVAAERAASRNESRYRLLAENSADTIAMSDASGKCSYISPAIKDVLGWEPSDIEGKSLRNFVHPDHLSIFDGGDDSEALGPRTFTFPARHRNGAWIWLEAHVRTLTSEGDGSYISNIRDFSRRKKAEEELEAANAELEAMAATDSLTGVANRRRFDEALAREWRKALHDQAQLALLLIDADHFKALNDHYGHQHGDRYLRAVANIIQNCIHRPNDMSARYGGEEFAVLLPNTDIEGAYVVAEEIRRAVQSAKIPHIKSSEGVMTVSIGVFSQVPTDEQGAFDLVSRADAALYAAKRRGRNCTSMFEEADAFELPLA